jgi:hypothetical protein
VHGLVIGNLALRFKVKRTPNGEGDHLGVVDGRVGPAFELALEGTGRAPLPHQLVEAREPSRVAMPTVPSVTIQVFSALAFRLAATTDTALLGAVLLRSAGVAPLD